AHARRANRNGKRKGDELSEEEVVLAFKKSCREAIRTRISTQLSKTKDKEDVRSKLYVRSDGRLPAGVKLAAFEDLRQSNERAKGLSGDVLTRKLGSEGSVKCWNARVDQDFDDVWAEEEK
ncbi:hypothetical protein BGZ72_003448, partial [Mortierella alpina]